MQISAEIFFYIKKAQRNGGYPPPPLTENRRKCSPQNGSKRVKNRVFGPKIPFFLEEFSLSWIGGYPPPPLTGKYFCNFSLAEKGVTPLPTILSGYLDLSRFMLFWKTLSRRIVFWGQEQCFLGKEITIAWCILHIILN